MLRFDGHDFVDLDFLGIFGALFTIFLCSSAAFFSSMEGLIFGLGFCPLRRAISSFNSWISLICSSMIDRSYAISGVIFSGSILGMRVVSFITKQ
jgi:hypothetical protein